MATRRELLMPQPHAPVGKRSGDGPAVSPDGKWLAFVVNGTLHVQAIDAQARPQGTPRPLTHELADSISWAGPDRVLYVATDRVKVVSVASGQARNARDIPDVATAPAHRPPGRSRRPRHRRRLAGAAPRCRHRHRGPSHRHDCAAPRRAPSGARHRRAHADRIPGLIEGHGHTLIEHGTAFGRVHLAYGVTSFRDVGGLPYDELESREAIDSGRRVGPRMFTTGYLLDGARPYYPMASTAPSEAVVDLEIERARRLDYDTFKTYVRLPDLLQRRAIEGAHRIGIPMSSHEIYPAALSGADSVEHTGATSRRGYSTKQSLAGRAYEDVIQILAKSRMTMTPTLGLGGFQTAASADPSLLEDPRWRQLQPAWADAAVRARRGAARPRTELTPGQRTVLALHRAGVASSPAWTRRCRRTRPRCTSSCRTMSPPA